MSHASRARALAIVSRQLAPQCPLEHGTHRPILSPRPTARLLAQTAVKHEMDPRG
jgi:hypothetical protein